MKQQPHVHYHELSLLFFMERQTPRSTLFPYTTLFRSPGHAAWLRILRRHLGSRVCPGDRKSTRLNSSHVEISYAVFCLKKKKICMKLTQRVHSIISVRLTITTILRNTNILIAVSDSIT